LLILHTDAFDSEAAIDPWSTGYWESEPKKAASKPLQVLEAPAAMLPPPAPSNAFAALSGGSAPSSSNVKLVKNEIMNDLKKAILDNKALSKVGIIDYIFQQFRDSASRTEVKNTIEHVAEKKGTGRSKEWELKPGHGLAA
jgi:chromatin assembly factor 1 subunit A